MTGEELRRARVIKKYTQKQLGEKLGLKGRSAEVMVQCWEYGTRNIPVKYFRQLSEILEVPLDKFIP